MRQTWNWQSSHTTSVFCILGEVGQSSKCSLKAQLPYLLDCESLIIHMYLLSNRPLMYIQLYLFVLGCGFTAHHPNINAAVKLVKQGMVLSG